MNTGELRPNRNHSFSLYFTGDEKQWLELLAKDDKISMAEEIRQLIFDEKERRISALKKRVLAEK